jgi:hypothetical protein
VYERVCPYSYAVKPLLRLFFKLNNISNSNLQSNLAMAAMRLLFLSTLLAAWGVQAGIVDVNAAEIIRRADHTSYKTTADGPTQTGIAPNCNKFYDIVTGDNCETVEAAFKITKAQFLAWNVGFASKIE